VVKYGPIDLSTGTSGGYMANIFTAYATDESNDLEKGKSYIVYNIRIDNGKTYFLVTTKTGELKWFSNNNFRV
jgi:hypothetical protein